MDNDKEGQGTQTGDSNQPDPRLTGYDQRGGDVPSENAAGRLTTRIETKDQK